MCTKQKQIVPYCNFFIQPQNIFSDNSKRPNEKVSQHHRNRFFELSSSRLSWVSVRPLDVFLMSPEAIAYVGKIS